MLLVVLGMAVRDDHFCVQAIAVETEDAGTCLQSSGIGSKPRGAERLVLACCLLPSHLQTTDAGLVQSTRTHDPQSTREK